LETQAGYQKIAFHRCANFLKSPWQA